MIKVPDEYLTMCTTTKVSDEGCEYIVTDQANAFICWQLQRIADAQDDNALCIAEMLKELTRMADAAERRNTVMEKRGLQELHDLLSKKPDKEKTP